MAGQVGAPGVLAALISGAIAAGICLLVGAVLAVAMPSDTIIGAFGKYGGGEGAASHGLFSECLADAVGLLLTGFDTGSEAFTRVSPLLFVLVPIGASTLGARLQGRRTEGMNPWIRVAWGTATGIPFAFIILVAAVSVGGQGPSVGGAFVLGLLWGGVGGAVGAARVAGPKLPVSTPAALRQTAAALKGAAVPLLLALAVTTVIGTAVWLVQAVLTNGDDEGGASLPLEMLERLFYAADHGVNYLALGFGTGFKGAPTPVADVFSGNTFNSTYRLFDFSDALPAYTFVPLLIVLILIPLVLMLYSGFACARAAGARNAGLGTAWGLAVGPVWSLALVILNATSPHVVGRASGDSLFGISLLAGLVLGGLGGLMAGAGSAAQHPDPAGYAQSGYQAQPGGYPHQQHPGPHGPPPYRGDR